MDAELVFPAAAHLIPRHKTAENQQKMLDSADSVWYYIGALRRQQVALAVNPAEDINNFI